jgi:hypothetical protein
MANTIVAKKRALTLKLQSPLPNSICFRIVSKRKESAYRSGRSPDYLKTKNANAPAVKREADEEWER